MKAMKKRVDVSEFTRGMPQIFKFILKHCCMRLQLNQLQALS
ncbi:hypothetical protein LZ3411_2307 [Levilactobacillus zymae]|uniref:Uncharacterized protein n=1 Tax=Levilactobacillus zymae TaxID=267363 RepID=A0A1Y6JZL5_9LACO|nr:hypothetical protein LZ3411_2307 [Levilactobacillus zymae]